MNKRMILWATAFILGVGLVVGLVLSTKNHQKSAVKDPSTVVSVVDKDTGVVVKSYPNQDKELTSQGLAILNGEELANFLGPGQYPLVADQIKSIIMAKTNQVANLAKIMPGSVKWDRGRDVLLAKVKQDSPALQFTAVIKLQAAGQVTVTAE